MPIKLVIIIKSQLCANVAFCPIIISVAVILLKRWSLLVHFEVIRFVNVIYQVFDAVCHHQMKYREES